MPTRRRNRTSATVMLVALVLGATAAGSATVAAQPRLTAGSPMAAVLDPAALLAPSSTVSVPAAAVVAVPPITTVPPTSPAAAPPPPPPPPPPAPTTTPAPRPTTTTAAPPTVDHATRVVELVNAERRKAGCDPLVADERLTAAAQAHSTDMAVNKYFSHTSQDGRTFADRITDAGYPSPAAENIAQGQGSAEDVMQSWMQSRGHRANILNCDYAAIGVGLDTRGWYWTQDFGF